MSWGTGKSQTTKHTHPVVFGRREAGCPRCAELDAGAAPVVQAWRDNRKCPCGAPAQKGCMVPVCRACEIRAHDCAASRCGAVCTAFQW